MSLTQSPSERAYRYFPDLSLPFNPSSKDFYIVTSDLQRLTPWLLYDYLIEDWAVCEDFCNGLSWVLLGAAVVWDFFSNWSRALAPCCSLQCLERKQRGSFFLLILSAFQFSVLLVFSWRVPVSPCLPKLGGLCSQACRKPRAQVHCDEDSVCEFSSLWALIKMLAMQFLCIASTPDLNRILKLSSQS